MIALNQVVLLFEVVLIGLVSTLLLNSFSIWVARKVGLVDIPGRAAHKQHAQPTPLAGGMSLFLAGLLLSGLFGLWHMPYTGLWAAATVVFLFGIWDDAKGLSALPKLSGQILASCLLIASGISVKFLTKFPIPLGEPALTAFGWILTILWLTGVTNAVNLIDSMDGLATGVSGIAFAFFMGMALVAQQSELALLSGLMLGICVGLYVFNVTPARLFLGDSGAQTLGFLLAAVAILYNPAQPPQASSWFIPIMVLGVPLFDTVLVILSRSFHHRPLFRADRSHTYHHLLHLGLSPVQAVTIIHTVALLLNLSAFIALSLPPLVANLVFTAAVCCGMGMLVFLVRRDPYKKG